MTSTTTPSTPPLHDVNSTPVISVVLSFRNEEPVIPELIARLQKVLRSMPIKYEIVFVNDNSSDGSLPLLLKHHKEDACVKVINMSRRFGVAECALAGMEHSRGDAVIIMDADLQDPPELIPQLFEKWRQGADVVNTIRSSRAGETAGKLLVTKAAYKAIGMISEIRLPENAGDYKLISRRVLTELLKMKGEREPYLRGLVTWMGFNQSHVVYDRQKRGAGDTHFPILRSLNPAKTFISGITSFSVFPLYFFLLTGLFLLFLSLAALVVLIVQVIRGVSIPASWPMMIALVMLSSVQLIGIGVIGVYLGKVYSEVRHRPNFIVESTVGFDDQAKG